jgi:hypothetical protein
MVPEYVSRLRPAASRAGANSLLAAPKSRKAEYRAFSILTGPRAHVELFEKGAAA